MSSFDVIVLGSGAAGLSAALVAAAAGQRVLVLGGTGPVGAAAAVLASQAGARPS